MVESDALRERVPEPELMDEVEQVVAYAEADFDAGHASLFQEALNRLPRALQVRRIWIWGVALVILVVGSHGRFRMPKWLALMARPQCLSVQPASQARKVSISSGLKHFSMASTTRKALTSSLVILYFIICINPSNSGWP